MEHKNLKAHFTIHPDFFLTLEGRAYKIGMIAGKRGDKEKPQLPSESSLGIENGSFYELGYQDGKEEYNKQLLIKLLTRGES